MSAAYSIATHKRYGLQRVCRIWQVPRLTVYAQRTSAAEGSIGPRPPKKQGPMGPCFLGGRGPMDPSAAEVRWA